MPIIYIHFHRLQPEPGEVLGYDDICANVEKPDILHIYCHSK
jgi:hypothetical protein